MSLCELEWRHTHHVAGTLTRSSKRKKQEPIGIWRRAKAALPSQRCAAWRHVVFLCSTTRVCNCCFFQHQECCVNVLVTNFKETILAECSGMIRSNETESASNPSHKIKFFLLYLTPCYRFRVATHVQSDGPRRSGYRSNEEWSGNSHQVTRFGRHDCSGWHHHHGKTKSYCTCRVQFTCCCCCCCV